MMRTIVDSSYNFNNQLLVFFSLSICVYIHVYKLMNRILFAHAQVFEGFSCRSCGASLSKDSLCFDHICMNHPDVLNDLSCKEVFSGLK